jgi:hypothetical protein
MGLDVNGVRALFYSNRLGVDFTKLAMIGRQCLHLTKAELKANIREFNFKATSENLNCIFDKDSGYAEELLRCLGANHVDSFDNSTYEGATYIHDMNQPIGESFKEEYSLVLDSGSLEHVFNFPIAVKNCMELVKVGGHFVAITPINNFVGHGFYQFSPELFFSVFTKGNGFELSDVFAFEDTKKTWYSVSSPEFIKGRVTLQNKLPTYLIVIAKRVSKVEIFGRFPQQSDYVSTWTDVNLSESGVPNETLVNKIKRLLPPVLASLCRRGSAMLKAGFDRRYFKKIQPASMRCSKSINLYSNR